ncbi:MAG: iron ABC transporter permease [Planctomycetia bacterium]|nr:iron ABC transporter permease [Planctomycetia bacterium]
MSSLKNRYLRYVGWKRGGIVLVAVLLPGMFLTALSIGVAELSWGAMGEVLAGQDTTSPAARILLHSRIPQALTAILAGSGLAMCGMVMQAVLRNPLSSPFTLGISSAAAFGAAVVVLFGGDSLPHGSVTTGAFVSSLLATGLILALSGKRHIRTETIILVGVALSSFYSAGMMVLQYIADEQQLAAMVYWSFGDTQRGTMPMVGVMGLAVGLAGLFFLSQSWNYNAILLGEEFARGLGVNVRWVRGVTMLVASLLTAILVATLGIIGFVGLVVPHLSRLLLGADHRYGLPFAILLGGLLLLVSDTLARTVLAPRLIPVSIVTAFLGSPIFLVMLLRRRGF